MSQYGVVPAFFMSFYSKKLYRDVAKNWGVKVFFYLLIVLSLAWAAFAYQVQGLFDNIYQRYSEDFVKQVPVITIKNGELSTPENRPYVIADPETKLNIAVVDTSGQFTTLEQAAAPLLITKTDVLMVTKPGQTKVTRIPATLSLQIDPYTISDFFKRNLKYIGYLFFGIAVFVSLLYRLIQALLYGMIGKVLNAVCDAQLRYTQLTKMAIVAMTPAIVLSSIFDFFAFRYHNQFVSYFIITMLYLLYGIIASLVDPNIVSKTLSDDMKE